MVRTCKRGHPRVPENLDGGRSCKECHRITQAAWRATAAGRASLKRADLRYYKAHREARLAANSEWRHANKSYLADYDDARNSTIRRWIAVQERRLRGERERVQAKLESLKKEEEEACRKLAALLIARK